MIVDGDWDSIFDFVAFDLESSTITGTSTLGEPIPAGTYPLVRLQFPPSVQGSEFCVKDVSKFLNNDQSINYEFEGPGCTILSNPQARMEFDKPREVEGEIELSLRMELFEDLYGIEVCLRFR